MQGDTWWVVIGFLRLLFSATPSPHLTLLTIMITPLLNAVIKITR